MSNRTTPYARRTPWLVLAASLLLPLRAAADDEPAAAEAPADAEAEAAPTRDHPAGHHHDQGSAPIGVMGAHVHGAQQWMISYRYMYSRMEGNLSGDASLSPQDVRDAGYMVVPTSMDMHMHMVGAMYAPIDELTIALMLPVTHMSMHHLGGMPLGAMAFDTQSAGIGDMRVAGLIRLFDDPNHQLLLGLGLVLPSGSTNVRGDTPMGNHVRLPYPMRLGGGSLAGHPSFTYTGTADIVSWGAQASAVLPMTVNEDGYRLGFEYAGTVWGAIQPLPWLGVSIRASGLGRENIDGADPDLNPSMVPTADPQLRGLFRLEAFLGLSFTAPGTVLEGHRLSVEAGLPYYQNVSGPQLGQTFSLTAGWQWTPQL